MPSSRELTGLPVVSVTCTGSTVPLGTGENQPSTSRRTTVNATMPAITSNVWASLSSHITTEVLPAQGVYVGAGNSPVSSKVAERIRRWELVDMADLLPEVRLSTAESEGKSIQRKPRCVTDIFSWLQCFGTYVSVLGPVYPSAILEMMAYMNLIVLCSQDYEGLAWVRYDMAFQRQAATSGNKRWSEVNSTLYAICFTGKSQDHLRCELCLAKSYRTGERLLQGHDEIEMRYGLSSRLGNPSSGYNGPNGPSLTQALTARSHD